MVLMVLAAFTTLMSLTRGTRPRRDFEGMEKRRRRAAQMFGRGKTQADVVRALGVSRQSVSRWYSDWLLGGVRAMKGAGRAGRLPRLDKAALSTLDKELRKGPKAHGFATELWTLPRIAEVIESVTGVAYHPGHVWKVLKKLGWTLQRPARRAVERDDKAVARWVKKEWPRIKRGLDVEAPTSSSRTSRASRSSPR